MERREPVGGVSTEPGTDSRVDHHTHRYVPYLDRGGLYCVYSTIYFFCCIYRESGKQLIQVYVRICTKLCPEETLM